MESRITDDKLYDNAHAVMFCNVKAHKVLIAREAFSFNSANGLRTKVPSV